MNLNNIKNITPKRTPRMRFLCFFIADIALISLSVYTSFYLRFDFSLPQQYLPYIPYYIALALLILLPLFYWRKMYYFTWAYISISNLINIFKAVSFGFAIMGLLLFLGRNTSLAKHLPRSIILIDYVITFILIASIRLSKRLFLEFTDNTKNKQKNKPKLLIIGAGDAAEQLIRSIKHEKNYPYKIAGILDDHPIKQNTAIHNIPVIGKINQLSKIKSSHNIFGIIIAIPSASSKEIQKIVKLAQRNNINFIKTVPSFNRFLNQKVSVQDVRNIEVEDLLGRKKINISLTDIKQLIKNKTVLITGAAGSIGYELVKQTALLEPKKIIALDMDETGVFKIDKFLTNLSADLQFKAIIANIREKEKTQKIFNQHQPEIVFHAAAYKHVKQMERYPEEAVLNNILGTWNVAEAALHNKVKKFILISTDKAVKPSSVMGMSKRIAEMLVMHYNLGTEELRNKKTEYIAVRFGNVLGSRGSVVPIFKEQILKGGPITITNPKMTRYFMAPSEAILLVLQAAYLGQNGEILILDMGEPIKILNLAKTMIKLAGLEPEKDIPIVFTGAYPGEKLFEEILTDKENMSATKHSKIFIAKNEVQVDKKAFFEQIEEVIKNAKSANTTNIKKKLQRITGELKNRETKEQKDKETEKWRNGKTDS